jgi:16S rRNA (guanine527-N7)-methyltransferase
MSFLEKSKAEGILSGEAFEKLNSFTDLILQWNPRVNLTGMWSRTEIEEILIGESMRAANVLQLSGKTVLDFGSGAGIPGLVWLICNPSIRLTSLEIRAKKVAFQKEVARKLQLNAEILCGRFPEAAAGREFDFIVTRAIRFDPKLWEQSSSLLVKKGRLVRFGPIAAKQDGWERVVISERSTLLLKNVPRENT